MTAAMLRDQKMTLPDVGSEGLFPTPSPATLAARATLSCRCPVQIHRRLELTRIILLEILPQP